MFKYERDGKQMGENSWQNGGIIKYLDKTCRYGIGNNDLLMLYVKKKFIDYDLFTIMLLLSVDSRRQS